MCTIHGYSLHSLLPHWFPSDTGDFNCITNRHQRVSTVSIPKKIVISRINKKGKSKTGQTENPVSQNPVRNVVTTDPSLIRGEWAIISSGQKWEFMPAVSCYVFNENRFPHIFFPALFGPKHLRAGKWLVSFRHVRSLMLHIQSATCAGCSDDSVFIPAWLHS